MSRAQESYRRALGKQPKLWAAKCGAAPAVLPILGSQLLELRPPFFFFENSLLQRPWPFRILPATLFPLRDPRRLRFRPATLEQRQQPEPGLLPVHRLGAGILIAHAQTARP